MSYNDYCSPYDKLYRVDTDTEDDCRDSDEYYDRAYEDYRAMQMMQEYEEVYA